VHGASTAEDTEDPQRVFVLGGQVVISPVFVGAEPRWLVTLLAALR
jgi:hypothetical protein